MAYSMLDARAGWQVLLCNPSLIRARPEHFVVSHSDSVKAL